MFTIHNSNITLCNYVVYENDPCKIALEIFVDNKVKNNIIIIPIDSSVVSIEVLKDSISESLKNKELSCFYTEDLTYKVTVAKNIISALKKISTNTSTADSKENTLMYSTFENYSDCNFVLIALPKATYYKLNVLQIKGKTKINLPVYKNIHGKNKEFIDMNIITIDRHSKIAIKPQSLLTKNNFMKNE